MLKYRVIVVHRNRGMYRTRVLYFYDSREWYDICMELDDAKIVSITTTIAGPV